jgi:hypothetical protein
VPSGTRESEERRRAKSEEDEPENMSSATVFNLSMFAQVDGVSAGPVRDAPPVITLVIIYDKKTKKAKRFQLPATHHS